MAADGDQRPFAWGEWAGGVIVALILGFVADVICLVSIYSKVRFPFNGLVGALPGVALAIWSRKAKRGAFAEGVFVGAILITMLGGICGLMT